MLIPVLFALAVVSVVLAGGRLERLAALRFRALWALLAGIAVQLVILEILSGDGSPWMPAAHVGSYLLVAWFLWRNRGRPELAVVALGGGANLAAITANAGVMPAHPAAWELAGLAEQAGFANSAVSADAPLWFLGDVFAVPAGWPLANVFSVGDVLLVAGMVVLLHRAAGSRLAPHARRAAAAEEPVPASVG